MNEEQQAVQWMRRLVSAAPDEMPIDFYSRLQSEIERLRAENAELRKLVQIAWDKGQWSYENWEDWSAQHPILQHNS